MKRILRMIWILTSAVFIIPAAGCTGGNSPNESSDTSTETAKPTETESPISEGKSHDVLINANSNIDEDAISPEDIQSRRNSIWQKYLEVLRADENRANELNYREMTFGDAVMRFEYYEIGEPSENGYPLFIAMHGGGSSDTPDMNNQQWNHMKTYYRTSIENGIYVAVRGVRDTWDTHFNPESYPLYDRLIENMIAYKNADPNRVYVMGFSAGGDGVYATAPRMSDRFAAASMSAGHPNGISLINLYRLPIILQCGELDAAFSRNKITAEYGLKLDALEKEAGDGYIHTVDIHKGKGHNFRDNDPFRANYAVMGDNAKWLDGSEAGEELKNSNAVDYLSEFTRSPLPERIVWDLSTRAEERLTDSFYWLKAPKNAMDGLITASYDRSNNRITIETNGIKGSFDILLNDSMIDFSLPVELINDGKTSSINVTASEQMLWDTTLERGDYNFQFAAKITISK